MKYIFLLSLMLFQMASEAQMSIMKEEYLRYKSFGQVQDGDIHELLPTAMDVKQSTCNLNKMVFGWHPYWQSGLEVNYQWNLLSDLCFFGYEVNPDDGNAITTNGWETNSAVTAALQHGTKVHLCVILFDNHVKFFNNPDAQNRLINNLINAIRTRGAHGINIDFEAVPISQKDKMTNFIVNLSIAMHAANPSYQLSVCLYAVDWEDLFDEPILSQYVDFFTILGYDYYWAGSSQAGPNDPLYGFSDSYDWSLSRTVTYYRNQGISENKLVLGLPYYGKEWETVSNTIPANTTGNNYYSRTYRSIRNNNSGFYTAQNSVYNQRSQTTVYIFMNGGTWRQCWITEADGMKKRLDFVNQRNLKGIAIWALGYDDGYTDFWDAIEAKITDCSVTPCTDTIYDGGGPQGRYYNNEDYTFTITPAGAVQTSLRFLSFETEANYDTLWLYDGPSTDFPLIGAYHGTNSPGYVIASGPSITLRFKSDGATRAPGWIAVWNGTMDDIPPNTTIHIPSLWLTQDTEIGFSDTDNFALAKAYWNVSGFDSLEWRGNPAYGFFYDDFIRLQPEWQVSSGNWGIENAKLRQYNESESNTNIYTFLDQTLSDEYVFEWKAITLGSGNNRRSGFHFASDNGSLANRGNSYFIWFRLDQQSLQFYKVKDDTFSLVHTVPHITIAGREYPYRVVFNRETGLISVFVDHQFVGSWQDTDNPYRHGKYISFRSGHAQYIIDDFRVFRSRASSEFLTVGYEDAMVQRQNISPQIPAAKIISLVRDQAQQFSLSEALVNVDWTAPEFSGSIIDGADTDADSFYNTDQFAVRWYGWIDKQSGIAQYNYGVGTAPGLDDVIPFTSNATEESCYYTSSNILSNGTTYYHTVQAVNHAGLVSQASSDGFVLIINSSNADEYLPNIKVYPNPAYNFVYLVSDFPINTIRVMDSSGKIFQQLHSEGNITKISIDGYAPGVYILELNQGIITRMIVSDQIR